LLLLLFGCCCCCWVVVVWVLSYKAYRYIIEVITADVIAKESE
jgi:hypothetical protein